MEKTSTGLQENVAGLLCYVAGWITGIIFLLIEKENKMVRFHAIQSIVVFGALSVLGIIMSILSVIPFVGVIFVIIMWLVYVAALILWIVLMVKTYQGNKIKLPWAGNIAEKNAG